MVPASMLVDLAMDLARSIHFLAKQVPKSSRISQCNHHRMAVAAGTVRGKGGSLLQANVSVSQDITLGLTCINCAGRDWFAAKFWRSACQVVTKNLQCNHAHLDVAAGTVRGKDGSLLQANVSVTPDITLGLTGINPAWAGPILLPPPLQMDRFASWGCLPTPIADHAAFPRETARVGPHPAKQVPTPGVMTQGSRQPPWSLALQTQMQVGLHQVAAGPTPGRQLVKSSPGQQLLQKAIRTGMAGAVKLGAIGQAVTGHAEI